MGIHECLHGALAYKLADRWANMSRFSQYIGDTDIIARFRVRQLRMAVLVKVIGE